MSEKIETPRLILRRWRDSDRAPFAQMNADPRVMRYFENTMTAAQSDALVDRIEQHFAMRGYGFWAVEVPDVTAFAGFIGLAVPGFEAPFTPCVEIGWRIAPDYWNRGYATEGARASLDFGFDELRCNEIVAFTAPSNLPSRRVMEKIGMIHDPADDFDHPRVNGPLKRQVLYRVRALR